METNIVFGVKVKPNELVYGKIKNHTTESSGINGYYDYMSDKIAINLESNDFVNREVLEIIDAFGKIVTHEVLHSEIYKATNVYATEKEEDIIFNIIGV